MQKSICWICAKKTPKPTKKYAKCIRFFHKDCIDNQSNSEDWICKDCDGYSSICKSAEAR